MVFSTTPIYALAVALIWLILWFRVTSKRAAMKQSIGDGGDPALLQWIRQHGNCHDWATLILILMILAEGERVEIGSFLLEDERQALARELREAVSAVAIIRPA